MSAIRHSIVMPIYNGAATLDQTLASIDPTGTDFEVVAVDQRSGDASRKILERYADRLPLKIIDAAESRSWTETTNIGFRAATGDVISMLHQDDLLEPRFHTTVAGTLEDFPNARLWLHGATFIDLKNRPLGTFAPPFGRSRRLVPSSEALTRLIVQNTVALPSAVFRREDVLNPGLDGDLWYTADWDLWLRLAASDPVAWSPEKIARFRVHAGSLTIKGSRNIEDFRRQLAIPVERHIAELPVEARKKARRLADASNDLNAYMAARFHGVPASPKVALHRLAALGPRGWLEFLQYSRLIQRAWPRLKLGLSRQETPQ